MTHHAESLRRYEKDQRIVDRIAAGDYADLPERLTAMLLFAAALTRYPGESRQAHVHALRQAGLDDGEILDATLVVAYFNFVNRIALGLGVESSDEEVSGYKA